MHPRNQMITALLLGCIATPCCGGQRVETSGAFALEEVARTSPALRAFVDQAQRGDGAPRHDVARGGFSIGPPFPRAAATRSGIPAEARTRLALWRRERSALETHWPADASGAIEVGLRGDSARVRATRVGASRSAGQLQDHTLVYREALEGVDSIVFGTASGAEELLIVRRPSAELAYDIELPPNWTMRLAPVAGAAVEMLDPMGVARIRLTATQAWDATGQAVEPGAHLEGHRLTIRLPEESAWPVVVDPGWTATSDWSLPRAYASVTLLNSGRVLVAGGLVNADVSTAELYDPATDTFALTAPLPTPAARHAAFLLRDGRVFLGDGFLYDETANGGTGDFVGFANTGGFDSKSGTATVLPSGNVLLLSWLQIARVFVPDAGQGTSLATGVRQPRLGFTASLLPDGRVMLAGGYDGTAILSSTEIYDPAQNAFVPGPPMTAPRLQHQAVLGRDGRLFVYGGSGIGSQLQATIEYLDVSKTTLGNFVLVPAQRAPLEGHTMKLLPDGRLLRLGGSFGSPVLPPGYVTADYFVPGTLQWADAPLMTQERVGIIQATVLADGTVFASGGYGVTSPERLVPLESTIGTAQPLNPPKQVDDADFSMTRLNDGRVLIVGPPLPELYDSATKTFSTSAQMSEPRIGGHCAVLLPSGKVLVAGGFKTTALTTAEIFDPVANGGTGAFTPTQDLLGPIAGTAAVLLANGKVLLPGSDNVGMTSEIFDPSGNNGQGSFSQGPAMVYGQARTAVSLTDGRVLFFAEAGATTELYEPGCNGGAGCFQPGPTLNAAHFGTRATLLPSGMVLVTGGPNSASTVAEVLDMGANGGKGAAHGVGNTLQPRMSHASVLLPSGRVLLAAGMHSPHTAELFDPVTETFVPAATPVPAWTINIWTQGILLPDGAVLMRWQYGGGAGLWREGIGPSTSLPTPAALVPSTVSGGTLTQLTGHSFWESPEGGGSQPHHSASNYPVGIWMPQAGGAFLSGISPWTNTSGTWHAPITSLHGPGLLFVSRNGVIGPATRGSVGPAPSGARCSFGAQCQSGWCVDGVCCSTQCSGVCRACSASAKKYGMDGVCEPTIAGLDPDDECGVDPPETCKKTGACNGAGACAVQPAGVLCVPAACSGDVLVNAYKCDGAGACKAGAVASCAPDKCVGDGGAAHCGTSCVSEADCGTGAFCDNGHCSLPMQNGAGCALNAQCLSLNCVDGVCCNSACDGACQACSLAKKKTGLDGACGPIAGGTDPDEECAPADPSTCGEDGFCSGFGGCRMYGWGTPCAGLSCSDGVGGAHSKRGGKSCDGFGSCVDIGAQDCGLFRCSGDVCALSCSSEAECIGTAWCNAGTCEQRGANGDACTADEQCINEYCVDGLCCNSGCPGRCEACDLAGKEGVCSTLPAGEKPHGTRPPCADQDSTCGGQCDGVTASQCSYAGKTVPCAEPSCTEGTARQSYCDGEGSCGEPKESPCVNFACGATACKASCTTEADCASQYKCDVDAGDCVPVGAKCDGDHTLKNNDVVVKDCAPYRCTSGNVCLNTCNSRADCVPSMSCTADGRCEPAADGGDTGADDGCSCTAAGRQRPAGTWLLMVIALAVWSRARRGGACRR